MGDLQARREAYFRACTAVAYLDDVELQSAVLGSAAGARHGWGMSQAAEIAGSRMFVKRIPVTDAERAHMFSTRNRFRLPDYYHYGVGSAGFGAFRELAAHVKTTNWVLEGAVETFPLLYHARMMERHSPTADPRFSPDDYVRRWNGSKAVGTYMRARADARHEIWLVLEHVPYTLTMWLPDNQGAVARVVDQLCRTIDFLRSNGVVHFDAHLRNVVDDGEKLYLTDFGLVLDAKFDLTERERAFLARHSHYDYGEAIAGVGSLVLDMVHALEPTERARLEHTYGIDPTAGPHVILATILDRLDDLRGAADLRLEPTFVDVLRRYRDVIVFMTTFLSTLARNPRKNTTYDDNALRMLLEAAGVLP